MKIAVPADGPSLEARIQNKLGTTPYLLVVDPDDMSFEVLDGPPPSLGSGAGVQALSIVLAQGANVILVGYISPNILRPLQKNGIEVITSVSGSVREAVMQYTCGGFALAEKDRRKSDSKLSAQQNSRWAEALRKTTKQYRTLIPVLTGVILLTGLFKAFLPKERLLSMFSGSMIQDTIAGAFIGSLLSGNPINSYVIGETFLEMGVDFFGVTAMMLTWVTVWLVQMPVELSVFGTRFTLIRNGVAFLVAIPTSVLIVWLSGSAS
jgi:predicted Fe-Mo cluster-binding NifX family protein